MSRRRFFSTADRLPANTGLRQRSWAECYAVSGLGSSWSISSDGSVTRSPDQSHTVDPGCPQSCSSSPSHVSLLSSSSPSSSSVRASPARIQDRSRPPSLPSPAPSDCRTVVILPGAQTNAWTRPPSVAPSGIQPAQPMISYDRCCTPERRRSHIRRRGARQRRTQANARRTHHGRRLGLHLPIAIPPDRWYTGVGSRVCAQCHSQRSRSHTSWMCLECRVPLCLLTWRNCYSQWHCGED